MYSPTFPTVGRVIPSGRYASSKWQINRQFERQLRGIRYDRRRSLELREEAPAAYKNIESVLRAQKDLVKIVRRLQPVLSYKGT